MIHHHKVESLDEIVFEERNQEYGAFVLRRSYNKRMTMSLGISFMLILLVFGYPVVASYLNKSQKEIKLKKEAILDLSVYKKEKDILPPPPPPDRDQVKELVKQVRYTMVTVVDSVADNQLLLIPEDYVANASNEAVSTSSAPVIVDEISDVVDTKKVDAPLFVVEEMPEFPGGEGELQKTLASSVVYPSAAKEAGIKGKVYVRFVITANGDVDQVQIARGVDQLLDNEAMRVVKLLPKWKPGRQQGNAVSVWYTVPINFILNE